MSDKPNFSEITGFDKAKLKKVESKEENPVPTKEQVEAEKAAEGK